MPETHNILTNREKNLCEYGATFGVLLSLTCLVQHIMVAIPSPVTHPMIPGYILAIIAFLLLGFQQLVSFVLLIISAVYCCVIEYLWLTHFSFSFVVLLLMLYHVIIIVALYAEQVPRKLKMKKAAEKAEQDEWAGKI